MPPEVLRGSKYIALQSPYFCASMHEEKILHQWSEIMTIRVHSILGNKKMGIFKLCFEMFYDKSLHRLSLPFRRRSYKWCLPL